MSFIYDMTDTWNAAGTTFNAIKMNVTDSASAAGSLLVNTQVGGVTQFSVGKSGNGYFAGNVGIGTSSPVAKLEVATGSSAAYFTRSAGNTGTSSPALAVLTDSATARLAFSGDSLRFFGGAVGTAAASQPERMRIDSSGNVGIGTSSPAYKLDVAGSARFSNAQFIYFNNSSGTPKTVLGYFSDNNTYLDASDGAVVVRTGSGPGERMRIDSSGNLLVGTTSSLGDGISAVIRGSASNTTSYLAFNRADTTASGVVLSFRNNGTVVGQVSHTNTTTTYATSSDARLKHDIIDAPEAGNLIDAIQVRSFKWNADDSEQRYGFVAQELVTVAPEAVSGDPYSDEMMGVDYSKLVPMLVKEIQSLRARVAQLEGN